MTDPRPPRPDDDPETEAPAIAARLTVPPAPPALVDAHVEAALAAYDEEHADGGRAGGGAAVSDLDARRTETPWYRRIPLGAVAAAAIVVGLLGVSQLVVGDEDGEETATQGADMADEAAPETESADDSADAFGTSEAAGGDSGSPDGRPVFASTDALVAHLEETLAGATTAARPTAGGGGGGGGGGAGGGTASDDAPPEADSSAPAAAGDCDAASVAGVAPDDVELLEAVILEGRAVTAVVHRTDDDRRVVVVDDDTCQVVEDRAF